MPLKREHYDGGLKRYVEEEEVETWWEDGIIWARDRIAEEDSLGSTLSTPVANTHPDVGGVQPPRTPYSTSAYEGQE